MTRAVLFDMDGTLLRLELDIEEVRLRLAALFGRYGVQRPFRPILRRIREAAAEAAGAGGDGPALERAGFALVDEWEVEAARRARPQDGAAEVVAELRRRHILLGLVTDNGRACLPTALATAGLSIELFDAIATRDDVPMPKPDPAGVLTVVRALAPQRAWYIGDHPKDVEAGRAASRLVPGMQLEIVAVRGGLAGEDALTAAGPDALVTSLRDVLNLPGMQANAGNGNVS